jgi:hypothetical protein
MAGRWITGKELMEQYELAAVELGTVIFEGRLKAYVPEVLLEVYELSKVRRVPKYPPPGIDAMQYVQTGEVVRWEWDIILGVQKLRIELLRVEKRLGECFAVYRAKAEKENSLWLHEYDTTPPLGLLHIPRYDDDEQNNKEASYSSGFRIVASKNSYNPYKHYDLKQLKDEKQKLEDERFKLSQEILRLTEPSFIALIEAQGLADRCGMPLDEQYSCARETAFKTIMVVSCNYIIDGEVVDESSIKDRLVYFDFDMYQRHLVRWASVLHGGNTIVPLGDAAQHYRAQLEMLWFSRAEAEEVFPLPAGHQDRQAPESSPEKTAPEPAAPPIDELTPHIVAWEAVLPKLNSSDKVAALLAIEKLKRKTHVEAYNAVCGDTVVASKIQYVSKSKRHAEKIAEDYGLTMPKWDSSKT